MISLGTRRSCPSLASISRCFIGAALLLGSGACRSDSLGPGDIDGISLWPPTGYFGPDGYPLVVGDSIRLHAIAYKYHTECSYVGCDSEPVSVEATFTWGTSDSHIIHVSNGLVRAVGPGVANVVAAAGGRRGIGRIRVGGAYVVLAQMSTHGRCALSEAGGAYCWDDLSFASSEEDFGMLSPRLVGGDVLFKSVSTGNKLACGIGADGRGYCWGIHDQVYEAYPTLISSGLTFRTLSVGTRSTCDPPWCFPGYSQDTHSCGVTVDGVAYCWGANDRGQLGTDAVAEPMTPVPVTGGHSFITISAGDLHTCALTADGRVYCWGDNTSAQLGDTVGGFRSEPVLVRGLPSLSALAAGGTNSCGLTSDGGAFCWGDGQPTPTRVAGDLSFRSIDAGGRRTCATTVEGQVYCWSVDHPAPTHMTGSPTAQSVGVSWRGTACAVATDGHVYCWADWENPVRLPGPIQP